VIRDLVAALIAAALVFAALALATTLHAYRRRLQRKRASEQALGREIIAEVPVGSELVLFTEDEQYFHHGEQPIPKDRIAAVRVLINGSPIASTISTRWPQAASAQPTSFDDRPEGIERDRWDVAIETDSGVTLVECGAIRERVSQELARRIYDAVRRDVERRDRGAPDAN
jgi:hypothetical protein